MIFCEIAVTTKICIQAKFYCFMATGILRAVIQSCLKNNFLTPSCIRESGITSALIETQISFHAHIKTNNMPFPMQLCFQGLAKFTFDLVFLKMQLFICFFNF
jgi:hypothetical protein